MDSQMENKNGKGQCRNLNGLETVYFKFTALSQQYMTVQVIQMSSNCEIN